MIDWTRYDVETLRQSFLSAEPFHHVVIDNFLDPDVVLRAENELRAMNEEDWIEKGPYGYINQQVDTQGQSKKMALTARNQIPPCSNAIIDFFQSEAMLTFLQQVTLIEGLQADETLLGGGIHKTACGGRLGVHADYNLHPVTHKHRRVNALLFLNSDWQPHHNGALELWSKDVRTMVKSLPPRANRLIVFRITDDAFHGHPLPWTAPFPRLSFAFYYFTDDRPEHEKSPFHWAIFKDVPLPV